MLTVHQITKSYNTERVLHDVTFAVNRGDRVGLIGPNGSGKTTLLRILAGQEQPDRGHVSRVPGDLRVGYLPQGFEPNPRLTVAEIVAAAAGDAAELQAALADLAARLAAEPERMDVQQAYDRTLARLSRLDESRAAAVLAHLDLDGLDRAQPAGQLSGGQKTRLALALVLLEEPDLLLLDEPTNHLDIEMLEWLEEWLAEFPGAALMVSHDRVFLDNTVTRILDLEPESQSIREYTGSYTDYLEQYVHEREKQAQAFREQEAEIRRMRQDIARTKEQARHVERTTTPRQPNVRRLAKKVARKAQAREKKLERYLVSDERVEKPTRSWQMKLEFVEMPHLGRQVLQLEDLAVGYAGAAPLLTDVTLAVSGGRRVAITGPNGAGKTTLLRTIAGALPPLAGSVRLGQSVQLGYMSQEQELLDPALNAVQTIQAVAALNATDTRSFLHYFLFSGDDPLRPVATLSFGERARLSLARLVAGGCNLLLLDEPINHLDIPSRVRFEQALRAFEGAILAVVHDRDFIGRFATDLWLVEDGGVAARILRQ